MCGGSQTQSIPGLPMIPGEGLGAWAARSKAAYYGGGTTTPPVPQPSAIESPIATEGQRAFKIAQLKRGILSTIKTSPAGIIGTGSDLGQGAGKRTLGGA